MHNLNQTQLIYLTLLVSFVTSIATGIMTTSLLQQTPVEVTRNINSVVEKTIQQVIPSAVTTGSTPPKETTTTVVVNEEDMIIASINQNVKSVVRINYTDALGAEVFYGIGVVMTKDGIIASIRQPILSTSVYSVVMDDGSVFKLVPLSVDKDTNTIFFKVNLPVDTKYTFTPAKLATSNLQLGQTVIGLGGQKQNTVAVGRVSSFIMKESGTASTTTKYISEVATDVSSKDLIQGSPFFDLSGNLVGMQLSQTSFQYFTPIALVQSDLKVAGE